MSAAAIKAELQKHVVDKAYFDIEIDSKPAGRIVFGLFSKVTPKTCENFKTLCVGDKTNSAGTKLAYAGSLFHRIIPNFMIQGGDFTRFNGTGGESIYGAKFADENFQLKHEIPFLLSMANAGRNTNGSQFFVTTVPTPHLDGRHVVFGMVISGDNIVKDIEKQGSQDGKPKKTVRVSGAGSGDGPKTPSA